MVDPDDHQTDQHFCLRWNNFQANITSQFELLRSDEDFTDVTIACDGQKLLAHKVVLSACSPYFKELFKANPCSHPIIFMRDVEARHIISLMEFMYVGEVNVSQAHLSTFLKTAESLKIRGLTDTSSDPDHVVEESGLCLKPQTIRTASLFCRSNILVNKNKPNKISQIPFSSTITSSQDVALDVPVLPSVASPVPKRSKSETEIRLRKDDSMTLNPFALQTESRSPIDLMPKMELPDYTSEDDNEQDDESSNFYVKNCGGDLLGNMEMSPQPSSFLAKDLLDPDITSQSKNKGQKLHSLDPHPCPDCGKTYSNLSNLRQHMKLVHFPTAVHCNKCNKEFKADLYFRRHINSVHKQGFEIRSNFNKDNDYDNVYKGHLPYSRIP
ncbi:protein tramtrack, beta isoform-like isoform X3 [Anthonomus grandis grandis]|uniref:protein tramtrack, beta isoform-like isoform X3 n=1 Tax=Anthonomus grandis grandis TaxID=2921223 RepID=UPI002166B9C5|nr:protein tramtrack, beta isoform-like isoform X3 [Anthonomus grandis grandis]